MGVPKRLTEMQKRFAEYLIFGGPDGPVSKSEAAELAGYSPKRSRVEGSELTNPRLSPLVVQYIGKLQDERLQKHEVSYSKHIAELDRIKQAALKKGSFSSAVNAEVSRGKAAGLYIDRKIIKTGKLEELTEEQLEAKMKQILDDYAPLLNMKIVEGETQDVNESELSSSHKKLETPTAQKSE
jgi:phage terminase small subunit